MRITCPRYLKFFSAGVSVGRSLTIIIVCIFFIWFRNDFDGDEKNINAIKTGLSDYPKFRCILVLMKFQDILIPRLIV